MQYQIQSLQTRTQAPQPQSAFQEGQKLIESVPAEKSVSSPVATPAVNAPDTTATENVTLENHWRCPKCGSKRVVEEIDKSRILYIAAGRPIYAKKHRCLQCSAEWH